MEQAIRLVLVLPGVLTILLTRPMPMPMPMPSRGAGLVADDSTMEQLALDHMVPVEVRDSTNKRVALYHNTNVNI